MPVRWTFEERSLFVIRNFKPETEEGQIDAFHSLVWIFFFLPHFLQRFRAKIEKTGVGFRGFEANFSRSFSGLVKIQAQECVQLVSFIHWANPKTDYN